MDTLDWLKRLVAFDTTSRYSNLQLIEAVQNWFKQHHISTRLTYDSEGKKANLFATIPGQGGNLNGGLILSGHTDVVLVDGQEWDTDPFELSEKDSKLYPVHFAFSYDEEVGCRGAPLMIADLENAGIKPSACIVGEPTSMHPVVADKVFKYFAAVCMCCAFISDAYPS